MFGMGTGDLSQYGHRQSSSVFISPIVCGIHLSKRIPLFFIIFPVSLGYDVGMTKDLKPCPVEQAIQVIGGKWKLLVLRSLLLNGAQRYNELLRSVTAISPKELTRNLRELADAKLVVHRATDGQAEHYTLTRLGESLMPVSQMLLTWGQELMKSSDNDAPSGALTPSSTRGQNEDVA